MSETDLSHLASLYALDALDETDRARFEAHLARHPDTRAEVAEFQRTVARIADASAEPAPASLRRRVLDEIASTPQVRLAEPEMLRRDRRWTSTVLAAAAAVALAVVGGAALRWRGERNDLAATQRIFAAPDARSISLAPGDGDGDAIGRVTWSSSEGRAVITAGRLDGAGAGRDYQLWLIVDGTPQSIGVIDGDSDTIEQIVVATPATGDAIGVTSEPDGGSPQPTGELVLVSDPIS